MSRASHARTISSCGHVDETRIEFHPQSQTDLEKLVFNLVERFLAEVSILEHFRFGFLCKLTDRGDVRVVQAIRRPHAQLDFIDAHVEQFFELHVFLAHTGRRFVELDHFLIEVDENIEVMAQNRGGLEERGVGSQTTVGPNFEDELVVVGALADAGVLDRIFHPRYRRKYRIDRDQTDRLIRTLVFFAGGETTTDTDIEFRIEFMFLVEYADYLFRIQDFVTLHELDIARGDFTLLIDTE